MKFIKLSKGKRAIVDDADFEVLNKFSWHFHNGYAVRMVKVKGKKQWKNIKMHRVINQTPAGYVTDHINRNPLDNRRVNLRTVSQSLNAINSKKRSDNKSGYRGVCWHKASNRWMVQYCGKYVGVYTTKREAIAVYKKTSKHA